MSALKLVAGNWKMNGSAALASEWAKAFASLSRGSLPCAAALCVPAVLVAAVGRALAESGLGGVVALGAEDVSVIPGSGAYTGEVSASMLRDAGCAFCIVGHSERRTMMGETDRDTALKVKSLADALVAPILCVGESLEERRGGKTLDVVARQLDAVDLPLLSGGAVAYEPLWAIGTGVSAEASDIAPVLSFIASRLSGIDAKALYGGSVKPGNARGIMAIPDCGGVLVGGASLDAALFHGICSAV